MQVSNFNVPSHKTAIQNGGTKDAGQIKRTASPSASKRTKQMFVLGDTVQGDSKNMQTTDEIPRPCLMHPQRYNKSHTTYGI